MINPELARVQDIILDEKHPRYTGEESVGNILYTPLNFLAPPIGGLESSFRAKPYYTNDNFYPVANEIVIIVQGPASSYNEDNAFESYYLPPIGIQRRPSSNALPDQVFLDSGDFYQGQYFREPINIRPLRPYEGDYILEGRFGNSLRFGSTIDNESTNYPNDWSNEGNLGNPITILKNGQYEDLQKDSIDNIIEDINLDHSSIYLCSSQQISNFIPASLHDASYGEDIFKEQEKEEVNSPNDILDENVEEDVELSGASNLPPEELQQTDELAGVTGGEAADFDNSPTEPQTINEEDNVELPSSYEVPSTVNLDQTLGNNPPPTPPSPGAPVSGIGSGGSTGGSGGY